MARVYYRIIRGAIVTFADFQTAIALGRPLRDPTLEREWREGVSVYDTESYAAARARAARWMLGRYVVAVRVPDDLDLEIRQTSRNRHHYTIYATPDELLPLVTDEPVMVAED